MTTKQKVYMFLMGLALGIAPFTVLMLTYVAAPQKVQLPACQELADSRELWERRARCAMDGENWLCEHGRCERIPAVP